MRRRTGSVLACLSLLACAPHLPVLDDSSAGDEVDESDDASETDGVNETDTGDESGCEVALDCEPGQTCVAGECTTIPEIPGCEEPPALAPLSLPSTNGSTGSIDVYDLDHDGDDELIAWIEESGIGVLDEGQWTISEFPEPIGSTSITALDVDGDALIDVMLSELGSPPQVGLGDGTGSFTFGQTITGVWWSRGIELAADQRWVFGMRYGMQGLDLPAYVRLDGIEPELVFLGLEPAAGWDFVPLRLDAEHEGVAYFDGCAAWPTRVNVDEPEHAIETAELVIEPHASGFCSWINADLDGDAREELVAFESFSSGAPPYDTVIGVLANQTPAGSGPPSFGAPQLAMIPNPHPRAVAGDLDGDGDDEILFTRAGSDNGEAMLVWASDEQLAGCMAEVPGIPDVVNGLRAGDLDGDGDDELAMFTNDGELHLFGG
jgi:hypothetical protein